MNISSVDGVWYERRKKKKTSVYRMAEKVLSMAAESLLEYGKEGE